MYLGFVFLVAALIGGFRAANVGIDTAMYLDIYRNIAENGLSELPRNTEVEYGYMAINWIFGVFISNPQIILLFCSCVTSYSFYRIINKYSKHVVLSSVLYITTIYSVTLNVMRQYLAFSIILFALDSIIEKKPLKALLIILFASTMHFSAVIYLPFVLFAFGKFDINRKNVTIAGIISLCMIPLYNVFIAFFASLFPQYMRFLMSGKATRAVDVSMQFVVVFTILLIINIFIMFFIRDEKRVHFSMGKYIRKIEPYTSEMMRAYYLFFLLFIGYIVIYIISRNMWIAVRFIYYFNASMILIWPFAIDLFSRMIPIKGIDKIITGLVLTYYIYWGYLYFINDPQGLLPFKFVI